MRLATWIPLFGVEWGKPEAWPLSTRQQNRKLGFELVMAGTGEVAFPRDALQPETAASTREAGYRWIANWPADWILFLKGSAVLLPGVCLSLSVTVLL